MKDEAKRVHWMMASHSHKCHECGEEILRGIRFAHYTDILAPYNGCSERIPYDYCEECGHLLEDSLTTTETVQ